MREGEGRRVGRRDRDHNVNDRKKGFKIEDLKVEGSRNASFDVLR